MAVALGKRFDPYRNFKFKVIIDSKAVAGLSKCSSLKKTTESTDWHDAGSFGPPKKLVGKTTYEPITLDAGITYNEEVFEQWANDVNNFTSAGIAAKNYRKNISIEVYNLQGKKVRVYNVIDAWVLEYQAMPDLDASGNAVMIQTLKLAHEGWERDKESEDKSE